MRATALLLVALGAAGCGHARVESEHVLTGSPGLAYAGDVKVVMDGSPVRGDYEEVAIVSATGHAGGMSLPSVLGALRREAASLGCNAVVRVRYDRGVETATATGVAVRLK